MKTVKFAALAALLPFVAISPASAIVNVLTFEGVGNGNVVGNFYNGGAGGNLGITFSNNALGVVDSDAGGTGNIGGEPSPSTALFFLSEGAATMNIAAGFDTGFSFFYSAINFPGFVRVYDGLNGTGNILGSFDLPLTPFNGAPDPTGQYSPFVPVGIAFAGIARSVDFGGALNQIAFDNITLGSNTAVPGTPPPPGNGVPDSGSTVALLGLSFAGVIALKRKLA